MAPRRITIHELELCAFDGAEATLRISCSKGTYIRALARDIAQALGTCAHLSQLRRIRIGGFQVIDARPPALFDPDADVLRPAVFFDAAPSLGRLLVKPQYVDALGSGRQLVGEFFTEEPTRDGYFGAFTTERALVAVIECRGGMLRYAAAFPQTAAMPAASGRGRDGA